MTALTHVMARTGRSMADILADDAAVLGAAGLTVQAVTR
jgi:hypothetical protein